ncbi:MAG: glycosyltransferase family 4 protein [Rhodobacteraceae bacterium]|nr:glycosyltransferase family 4 protein [Paracoccaceae bacterium]
MPDGPRPRRAGSGLARPAQQRDAGRPVPARCPAPALEAGLYLGRTAPARPHPARGDEPHGRDRCHQRARGGPSRLVQCDRAARGRHRPVSPPADRAAAWAEGGLPGTRGIGAFGRIRPSKGSDLFVEAMCRLLPAYPGWTAFLTGLCQERDRRFFAGLRARIARAGLADRIFFLGDLAPAEIRAWYRRASLVVAASRSEGFGLTPLEAFASGAPAVTSRAGVWPDLVTPEFGALFDTGDVDGLIAALRPLMADPDRVAAMGRRRAATPWRITQLPRRPLRSTRFMQGCRQDGRRSEERRAEAGGGENRSPRLRTPAGMQMVHRAAPPRLQSLIRCCSASRHRRRVRRSTGAKALSCEVTGCFWVLPARAGSAPAARRALPDAVASGGSYQGATFDSLRRSAPPCLPANHQSYDRIGRLVVGREAGRGADNGHFQ